MKPEQQKIILVQFPKRKCAKRNMAGDLRRGKGYLDSSEYNDIVIIASRTGAEQEFVAHAYARTLFSLGFPLSSSLPLLPPSLPPCLGLLVFPSAR